MEDSISILVVVRNSIETIDRTLKSAISQGNYPVLVLDDASTDSTFEWIQHHYPSRIQLFRNASSFGIGHARNQLLKKVETPYAVWVDADDEMLPGRVDELHALIRKEGAALVFDHTELYDGETNQWIRNLEIPEFLKEEGNIVRQFERNYIPGPAWHAFDVAKIRELGGYDSTFATGDDYDLILRVISATEKISFSEQLGYRQFAYSQSVSRNISRQNRFVRLALKKHSYTFVESILSHMHIRIKAWSLVSFAMFRHDWEIASEYLAIACPSEMDPNEVLEPHGFQPFKEGWRYGFMKGTIGLFRNDPRAAISYFNDALKWERRAETFNNRGIALFQIGETKNAQLSFSQALDIYPGYFDAETNLASAVPESITKHPLRHHQTRSEY